jgi:hypothetical protein
MVVVYHVGEIWEFPIVSVADSATNLHAFSMPTLPKAYAEAEDATTGDESADARSGQSRRRAISFPLNSGLCMLLRAQFSRLPGRRELPKSAKRADPSRGSNGRAQSRFTRTACQSTGDMFETLGRDGLRICLQHEWACKWGSVRGSRARFVAGEIGVCSACPVPWATSTEAAVIR